jgi:DMSO/TMAO reductase YedYZ molybdopterin-dependent catalytic subunit
LSLIVHYACFYGFGISLWPERIGEWIMARTPNAYSVLLLECLGAWAKPFAVTGGLAALGFAVTISAVFRRVSVLAVCAVLYHVVFEYPFAMGTLTFWMPAAAMLAFYPRMRFEEKPFSRPRRYAMHALMGGATSAVALESRLREESFANRAVQPVPLWAFEPPLEQFGQGLVRRQVTPVGEFYTMSKNAADPMLHPSTWSLSVFASGDLRNRLSYSEILQLPRQQRYVTLRCVSNTLKSDLMGTAEWSGIRLEQLIPRSAVPPDAVEVAFIGADGHGDSLSIEYAYSGEVMLALGMNGSTLNRAHGFPLRLLCPRYYGFKNVKWLTEIRFVNQPYFGTWPRMGYTKEPIVKIATYIDKAIRDGSSVRTGGVSFAGSRGIQAVEVQLAGGEWHRAELEKPLSPYTWTRWTARFPYIGGKDIVEARAQDGAGAWQLDKETPLFPDGVGGPSSRKLVG